MATPPVARRLGLADNLLFVPMALLDHHLDASLSEADAALRSRELEPRRAWRTA